MFLGCCFVFVFEGLQYWIRRLVHGIDPKYRRQGWKVLHIGDGDITASRIDGLNLAQRNIDVALVHDRCLVQKDCAQRMKQMNVGKVVFIHMTDNRIKPVMAWIKEHLRSASILATGHGKVSILR